GGEQGAQLVGAQGIERDVDRLVEQHRGSFTASRNRGKGSVGRDARARCSSGIPRLPPLSWSTTTPPPKPSTAPCPKCGRPLAVSAKRCLYCGHVRILAAPGTPEYDAERAAAEADAKRLERQKVIYQHGMGLGKSATK